MATYTTEHLFAHSAEQIFSVVADVERYPDFLPLWEEAQVVEQDGERYCTDQVIRFGFKPLHFRSKTVLKRPTEIQVTAAEGLFRELIIRWLFQPASASSCSVQCRVSCQMQEPFLETIVDLMLPYATQTTVLAFEKRAQKLDGALPSCLA